MITVTEHISKKKCTSALHEICAHHAEREAARLYYTMGEEALGFFFLFDHVNLLLTKYIDILFILYTFQQQLIDNVFVFFFLKMSTNTSNCMTKV